MPEVIEDNDDVGRSLFDPKDVLAYISGIPQLKDLNESNLQFTSDSGRKESVNCLRLLPAPADNSCHAQGVSKQNIDNQRIVEVGGDASKKRTYIGYALGHVASIRSATQSDCPVRFDVIHDKVEGNDGHCNIVLNEEKADNIKKIRQAAISNLSKCFKDRFVQYNSATAA